MEKHSIKISILGRHFPVLVDDEEAAAVQQAAKLINEKVKNFRVEYGMRDDTDIVIMCCLDIATEWVKMQQNYNPIETQPLLETLARIEKHLDISAYIEE